MTTPAKKIVGQGMFLEGEKGSYKIVLLRFSLFLGCRSTPAINDATGGSMLFVKVSLEDVGFSIMNRIAGLRIGDKKSKISTCRRQTVDLEFM